MEVCACKVDANRGNVRLGVGVVGESEQQAGLAHTRISNQEQLEQIIATRQMNHLKKAYYSGFMLCSDGADYSQ
jgi:hypothetical protein